MLAAAGVRTRIRIAGDALSWRYDEWVFLFVLPLFVGFASFCAGTVMIGRSSRRALVEVQGAGFFVLLLFLVRRREQGRLDYLIHIFYERKVNLLANLLRDFRQIFAVLCRDDDVANVGLVSGQDLFAQATDAQYAPA